METLFKTLEIVEDKPTRKVYSKGFLAAYKSYGHYVGKNDAYKEWVKQNLEHDWQHISDRAFIYYSICLKDKRWMMDFRRWLHNERWNDIYPNETMKFYRVEDAYVAFKKGEWNFCDDMDCTDMRVCRNSSGLNLGNMKTIWAKDIRKSVFTFRAPRKDARPKPVAAQPLPPPTPVVHEIMTAEEKARMLPVWREMARGRKWPRRPA